MECQHFMNDAELRPLTASMLEAIQSKAPLDNEARYALDTCISEMLENVLFHADTPYGGVAAVQAFKSGELELAIVDLGVGIAGSLAKNPDYADRARKGDLTAIQTAMVPNVTSTPWRNKGWGLAFTELLLQFNEGRMIVRSGQGYVMRGAKSADKVDADQPLPGTLVAMRIKIDQPLDYSKAWALLDEAIDTVDTDHDDADGSTIAAG
jgi:anti-sigma regulatory factor (Ser/Thr protein kinase)